MKAKFINNHFHLYIKNTLVAVFANRDDYIAYIFRAAGGRICVLF